MFKINLQTTDDYILSGYYQRLYVKHGSTIEIDLDYFEEAIEKIHDPENNFTRLDQDEIRIYFEKLLLNEFSVNCINGIRTETDIYIGYNCDYCTYSIFGNYYYCYECHKDMCDVCYHSEEEEDDLDGITQKKYYCKQNHFDKIKTRIQCNYNVSMIQCDVCTYRILDPIFYSNEESINIESTETFDLCLRCFEKNPELVEEKNLFKISLNFSCNNCLFDNMMDWIPVLKDLDNSFILINKNTLEYCLFSCNTSNQYGYYVLSIDKLNSYINEIGSNPAIILTILSSMSISLF
mgnify:CR=1 FL=1